MKLCIGLMSGTSMDGIDAALVDVTTNTLIAGITRPYGVKAKTCLQAVLDGEKITLANYSQLNTLVGREFAYAVHQLMDLANITPQQVEAIGSHGQTICHDAMADIPYTVQLGCAHTIAELTGINVIADFRTRDLVIGGQGAPFAPLYHQALFAKDDHSLAIVNIGGIANVTYLASSLGVTGHDTGPGNCLLDAWIKKHLGEPYDASGAWAASGEVIKPLLVALQADPYFKLPPPKSIGKEYFSDAWLTPLLEPAYAPHHVQATLLALTATTIAAAIKDSGHLAIKEVVICGGGAHNRALLHALAEQLPGLPIHTTVMHGIDPDFLEAMMFAWLAEKALNQIPLDLSQITGAKKLAIYGVFYAAGIDKGISVGV